MASAFHTSDSSEDKQLIHHEVKHFPNKKWFVKTYLGYRYDTTYLIYIVYSYCIIVQ